MSTQPPTPSPARSPRPATRSPLVFLAIAGASVVAAGVGGYVAQSHRPELPAVEARPAEPSVPPISGPVSPSAASPATGPTASAASAPTATTAASGVPVDASPVAAATPARPADRLAAPARVPVEKPRDRKPSDATSPQPARVAAVTAAPPVQTPRPTARTAEPAPAVELSAPESPAMADVAPPAPIETTARPQAAQGSIADTFIVPADSVIGLQIEHSVSSETALPEDRVDARVARDVKIDGTVVIPAGSRVRGAVTRVESGGRFKERGRIEIRFHTLVLADGDTQALATDTLFREGESVGRRTGARIGASAAGGAIIGAIFGGEKGAAIGAAAGAGAGTAVTAAQKPSEAGFRAGAVVTVRLTAPVAITVQE